MRTLPAGRYARKIAAVKSITSFDFDTVFLAAVAGGKSSPPCHSVKTFVLLILRDISYLSISAYASKYSIPFRLAQGFHLTNFSGSTPYGFHIS
jgi:hypothetical protein